MRAAVNAILVWSALTAIPAVPSIAWAAEREAQQGESRWVPSLAVTSGITFQQQKGAQTALRFDNTNSSVSSLRPAKSGDDRAVSAFVGAALELMTPALPLLASPRFFASAEILPTFASERLLTVQGDPSRLRGPDVGAVLAGEEDSTHYTEPEFGSGPRQPGQGFSETEANGQGMRNSTQIDTLVFGAKLGVAFAFQLRGRQLRIKPAVGWIHYKVSIKGYLVDATCDPATICTDTYLPDGTLVEDGFFRESILQGRDSGVFDGVGPGVDLEMDTGRYGPLGTSLFLGVHAYYIPGDRDITFAASRSYNDQIGDHTESATWSARVAPWLYRAGIGIRFQWLGFPQ